MGSEISCRSKRSGLWGLGEMTVMETLLGDKERGGGRWEGTGKGGKAWACSRERECLIRIFKVKIWMWSRTEFKNHYLGLCRVPETSVLWPRPWGNAIFLVLYGCIKFYRVIEENLFRFCFLAFTGKVVSSPQNSPRGSSVIASWDVAIKHSSGSMFIRGSLE